MSEHTPGPWEIEPDDDLLGVYHLLTWAPRKGETWGTAEARDNANACLIEAAPDLLALCERLREFMEMCLRVEDGWWGHKEGELLADLEAAIAKARAER